MVRTDLRSNGRLPLKTASNMGVLHPSLKQCTHNMRGGGQNPLSIPRKFCSAPHSAAGLDDGNLVEALRWRGGADVNVVDEAGRSALQTTTSLGDLGAVRPQLDACGRHILGAKVSRGTPSPPSRRETRKRGRGGRTRWRERVEPLVCSHEVV